MAQGETKTQYRRNYICVNPDPSLGPETWRVASPQSIASPGSGGGAGTNYDFDGVVPINVTETGDPMTGTTRVDTSIDIQQLDDRTV